MQGQKRADRQPVVQQQDQRGDAQREPQPETEQAHHGVMAEQGIRKDHKGVDKAGPGSEQLLMDQFFPCTAGAASAREIAGHQQTEPVRVGPHQQITGQRPAQQSGKGHGQMRQHGAHRAGKSPAEKILQTDQHSAPGTVHHQIGPQGEIFQIQQQIAVKRDMPRHGEGGHGRAVQQRQPPDLLRGKRFHSPFLRPADHVVQRAPDMFPPSAELRAAQHQSRSPSLPSARRSLRTEAYPFFLRDVRSGERPGICPDIPGNIRNDILHSRPRCLIAR